MKLHTGDTVVIIAGKDKGKTGTVMRVLLSENRIVVGGANMRTRHVKKTTQEAGRIVKFEASLHASNVMLVDPKTKKRARVGYKADAKGVLKRISKKSGEVVVPVRADKLKKGKKTADAADGTKVTDAAETAKGGAPFWRRKGGAGDSAEVKEGSHMSIDKSLPDIATQGSTTHRSGGRGS